MPTVPDRCEHNSASPRIGWVRGPQAPARRIGYSPIDNLALFEGDIILGTVEALEKGSQGTVPEGSALTNARWPDGEVPYVIAKDLPEPGRVHDALAHWQERTNVRFRPSSAPVLLSRVMHLLSSSLGNCVVFRRDEKVTAADLGMIGGAQCVLLQDAARTGNVIHEIGHALGLWHEQSRVDRDHYVKVLMENVEEDARHNFTYRNPGGVDLGSYDYGSIMHYSAWAWARGAERTIVCDPYIGQRDGVSAGDVFAVNFLYPRRAELPGPSDLGPALAVCGPRLLVAWTAKRTDQLFVCSSEDGLTFPGPDPLPGRAQGSPALCGRPGEALAAWVDRGSKKLHLSRSADGQKWGPAVVTPFSSLSSPALAAGNGRVLLAWRGQADNRIRLAESADGMSWSDERSLAEITYSGPALSLADDRLLLGWRGPDASLWAARVEGPTTLTDRVSLRGTTAARPCLHAHAGRPFLAWNDEGSVALLEEATPATWVGPTKLLGSCLDGPALATHEGRLVIAAVAPDEGNRLKLTLI